MFEFTTYAYIWLFILITLITVEAITVNLVSIWFAAGALAAFISSGFGAQWWTQVFVFAVTSAIALVLTRPMVERFQKKQKVSTNADRVIGAKGLVIKDIDKIEATGQVKTMGQIWSAKSVDQTDIKEGSEVLVVAIEGVKLIVKKEE